MHRFGRIPEASLKDLCRVAIVRALADARMGTKDIQAVYSANGMAGVLQGQEQIRGQSVLREVGLERIPVTNVENACASGSTALREAIMAVRAEAVDVALVLGFEKMFVGDLDRSLTALESAADLEIVAGLGLQFPGIYAMRLRKRLDDGSLSLKDLVDVTVKSHQNGALNPYAQYQRELSSEEVLGSRMVADPLTLLMCSSICDGAAAVVVARKGSVPVNGPEIVVRASIAASGFTRTSDQEPTTATICAGRAYEEAGVGPADINVAEVHDAMAPGELLYYEQLGFCESGAAGDFLRSGASSLRGRIPVNPSGGLSARGHPVGATGVAQIVELVWQLRGEAGRRQVHQPRLALAHNSGGWLEDEPAACNVHILERTKSWN
jgi:acetyl-CoA acetyltransferase